MELLSLVRDVCRVEVEPGFVKISLNRSECRLGYVNALFEEL